MGVRCVGAPEGVSNVLPGAAVGQRNAVPDRLTNISTAWSA